MTKREYFAAIAAQGIAAGADYRNINSHFVNDGYLHPGSVAKLAVEIADALISALNEPTMETPA